MNDDNSITFTLQQFADVTCENLGIPAPIVKQDEQATESTCVCEDNGICTITLSRKAGLSTLNHEIAHCLEFDRLRAGLLDESNAQNVDKNYEHDGRQVVLSLHGPSFRRALRDVLTTVYVEPLKFHNWNIEEWLEGDPREFLAAQKEMRHERAQDND